MVRDRGRETGTEGFDMRRFRRPLPAPLTIPMDFVKKLVLQNTRLLKGNHLGQIGAHLDLEFYYPIKGKGAKWI